MDIDKKDSADDDDFTVYNRDDIVGILRGLARNASTLSATFNHGTEVLLTQVLAVDIQADTIYLDTNANADSNARLLLSDRTFFVSINANATVKWTSAHVHEGMFEERKAFQVALPETLRRIQRRGVYRVATPITHPVMCRMPINDKHEVNAALVDICVEGVGVILPAPDDPAIKRGAQFPNCTITLPNVGVVTVTLAVQAIWEIPLTNGQKSRRAGLEFVSIQPGVQSLVQRYVNKLDCERISTLKNR